MGLEQTDWGREAGLVRPARLTLGLFDRAPALESARPWVPDHLLPVHGGDAFLSLTPSQRLRYNHAYARQLIAEFVWLETFVIVAPLERVCRTRQLDQESAVVLQSFISDERHHIESFSHLGDLAAKADGTTASPLQPPRRIRVMAAAAARFPVQLSFWAAATAAFEQYTIKLAQAYHREEDVDRLFREVFMSHARDEARHCRLDALIEKWLSAQASVSWTRINAALLKVFQSAYYSVGWGLDGPLRDLVRRYPETADKFSPLLAEAKARRRAASLPAASE